MTPNKNLQDLPDEIQPCDHMTTLVSRRADETLQGPVKWYTDFHVMTCPHCRAALEGLRALQAQMEILAAASGNAKFHLSDSEWDSVEKALHEKISQSS